MSSTTCQATIKVLLVSLLLVLVGCSQPKTSEEEEPPPARFTLSENPIAIEAGSTGGVIVLVDGERSMSEVSASARHTQGSLKVSKDSQARDYFSIRPSYFASPHLAQYVVTVKDGIEDIDLRGQVEIVERQDSVRFTMGVNRLDESSGTLYIWMFRSGNADIPVTIRFNDVPGLVIDAPEVVIPQNYRRYNMSVRFQITDEFEDGAVLGYEASSGDLETVGTVVIALSEASGPFDDMYQVTLDIQGEGLVQWYSGDARRPSEWTSSSGVPELPARLNTAAPDAVGYSVVAIDAIDLAVSLSQSGHTCSQTAAGTDSWGMQYSTWICSPE